MPKRCQRFWSGFALCVAVIGCDQPAVETGPSYAELVVTYNAELEALDRLEAKRDRLIKNYAAASVPTASANTLSELKGLLDSAHELKDGTDLDATADPEALLDSLTQRSGEAEEIANQLLGGLLGEESNATEPEPNPERDAEAQMRKAAFDAELTKLDTEIAKQKERVERARLARDEAEAKSQAP